MSHEQVRQTQSSNTAHVNSHPASATDDPAWLCPFLVLAFVAGGGFDEGAAQVRRLLDRDRKEMDFDELDKSFAASGGDAAPASASEADAAGYADPTPSNSGARFASDKTPVSPFGPSAASSPVPFSSPASSRKPFAEPAGLSPTMPPAEIAVASWWTKITLTQIVSRGPCSAGVHRRSEPRACKLRS